VPGLPDVRPVVLMGKKSPPTSGAHRGPTGFPLSNII
jgi:hypothetical protein